MTVMLIVVIGGIGLVTSKQIEQTIETQMGNNAMDLAVTIASMDKIKETLATTKDYRVIQETVENIRKRTRFHYIIVLDMDGIKYSYPYKSGLGKKYISGGEERVLQYGEAYVSADRNVLISAIRAFVPIFYKGEQVGAVIVGLLNDTVYDEVGVYLFSFRVTMIVGLIIGIIFSLALTFTIKRTIFGLEPKEIALLLGQRDLILQNLKNGILAVDKDCKIILFNKAAKRVFGFSDSDIGKNIVDVNSTYANQINEVLRTGQPIYNQEIKISPGITLLCSHTLLKNHKDETIGVVSSFQDLTEVKQMAEELTGIKRLTFGLRAQSHEFMNKLHTISGLLQLEEYDKAIEYISNITQQRQEIMGILNYKIKDPHIAGLLLAKYNKAAEAKITLEIDPHSTLDKIPKSITADEICSVIGNLIENAIEELVNVKNGKITIFLKSHSNGLKIRIQDNGPGIKEEIKDKIFERGVTTKEGKRGLGLWIVKQIIDNAKGTIKVIQHNGTIWDIYIPKEGGK